MKNPHRGAGGLARRSALAISVLLASLPTMAQPQFDRYISFGDSYADPGINMLPLLLGIPGSFPSHGAAPEVVQATSPASTPYVAFPYWLQEQLGLSNTQMTSYAIGGSTTQTANAVGIPFSLPYQLASWGGARFSEHDLVSLTIGGNDGLLASGSLHALFPSTPDGLAFSSSAAVDLADSVSGVIQSTVGSFAAAGARNIMLASFSDMAGLPVTAISPHRESMTTYGENLYQGVQERLRPLALSGTRIFLLDLGRLASQFEANLAGYGFGSYSYSGANGQPSVFQPDGIHLSSHGFEVMAQYMRNVLAAPYSHALQPQVAQATATTFTDALLDRLDAGRTLESFANDERFSIYAIGAHRRSDQDDSDHFLANDYSSGTGIFGGELRITSQLRTGLALSYTRGNNDLDNGDDLDDKAIQLAGYLSYSDGAWFGDALLGYGRHNLDLDRRGVLELVSGSTEADTFGIALRGGYLFDLGRFRAGPIVSLRYTRAEVDGYGERGDALLAYRVDDQDMTSKIGEAGFQLRTPFAVAGRSVEGYLNLTWQHEFGDMSRSLTTTLEQAPLLPIRTTVEDYESRDSAVISGGVSFAISNSVSVAMSASSEFGNSDSRQLGMSLDYRF